MMVARFGWLWLASVVHFDDGFMFTSPDMSLHEWATLFGVVFVRCV